MFLISFQTSKPIIFMESTIVETQLVTTYPISIFLYHALGRSMYIVFQLISLPLQAYILLFPVGLPCSHINVCWGHDCLSTRYYSVSADRAPPPVQPGSNTCNSLLDRKEGTNSVTLIIQLLPRKPHTHIFNRDFLSLFIRSLQ